MAVEGDDFDLVTISLGAGVQSSTMYRMAALGEIPGRKPDVAIFADVGDEPSWVYKHLDLLEEDHGDVIPIHRVSAGHLSEDWFRGQKSKRREENAMGAAIPAFLRMPDGSKGMANRTCTQRYKVAPILAETRRMMGLRPGQRVGDRRVEAWIGISLDEVQRVKDSEHEWQTNRYPLVFDVPMRRSDCIEWNKKRGYEVPKRSACVFCPFHSNASWRELKASPKDWAKGVEFDRRLREEKRFVSSFGDADKAQLRGVPFVHSSRVPLEEANLYDVSDRQLDMFDNECEGMCGV